MLVLLSGRLYDQPEATARRLEREDFVNRDSYEIRPHHSFSRCKYCFGVQGWAVLEWSWQRWSATSNGSAETCAELECARAVLRQALDDGCDPEDITVRHPITVTPDVKAA